jgi:hypothetical protein
MIRKTHLFNDVPRTRSKTAAQIDSNQESGNRSVLDGDIFYGFLVGPDRYP